MPVKEVDGLINHIVCTQRDASNREGIPEDRRAEEAFVESEGRRSLAAVWMISPFPASRP